MKKSIFYVAAAMVALSGSAMAAPTGTASFTASAFEMDHGYANGGTQSLNSLMNLTPTTKLGLSVTNINAFHDHARVLSVRAVHDLDGGYIIDGGIARSDRAKISIKESENFSVRKKVLDRKNLIVGLGVSSYNMREGGRATAIRPGAVLYVPGVPLVLQADVAFSRSNVNGHKGHSTSLAATYGRVGEWTTTVSASSGRVHYELLNHPGAIADYYSTSAGVSGQYWLTPSVGISAGMSKTSNRYFHRKEARVGVFWSF